MNSILVHVFKVLTFLLSSRKSITAEFDEKQYLFLKRLCQVLVALGEVQLFYLWVRKGKVCIFFFASTLIKVHVVNILVSCRTLRSCLK